MTKSQLLTYFAATITTLAEVDGTPESTLYLMLGMDMDKWQTLRGLLLASGMVKISGNYVTITESGRIKAAEINNVIKAKGLA